ncbi:MAG: extensin family protein [Pseudomonadota bacterium]
MRAWLATLFLWAGVASAAPETSLRPVERAGNAVSVAPSGALVQPRRDAAAVAAADRGQGLAHSLRPELRPRKFRRIAREQDRLRKRGAVCGDLDIQGEVIGRVQGTKRGCGVENAVRVKSVSGVGLSLNSVLDCGTAKALKTWVEDTAKPALRRQGGGLKRLRVAAHYACRTRNNQPGGRISEHGKGRAIDISAFRLRDGSLITVQNGWNGANTSQIMRRLHRGACGPFGTVLGPSADRFHRDHFHFDTARYRSGPYCR